MVIRYFAYLSRGKIAQLYDQITELSGATEKHQTSKSVEGRAKAAAGWKALLSGELEGKGARETMTEITGTRSDIQKLQSLLNHIEAEEYVADLNELCRQGAGAQLNAFAYTYKGSFQVLGSLDRKSSPYSGIGGININESVLNEGSYEVVLSHDSLVKPARAENAYRESGPNNAALVSNIAILVSQCHDYTISLACSYKYFSDMGGSWIERTDEWVVSPHSGNGAFFYEGQPAFLEGLIFVNGVQSHTIFGSPLFLNHAVQDNLVL